MFSPQEVAAIRQKVAKDKQFHDFLVGLFELHDKFIQGIKNLNDIIEKKVGPPGKEGPRGPKGDTPDINMIIDQVQKKIRIPKDGYTPDVDEIVPVKGVHYFTEKDKAEFIKQVTAHVRLSMPEKQKEVDPMSILDAIMKLPNGKRIPSRLVDGLEQTMSALHNQTRRGYLHGAGITALTAGSNITLVKDANGNYTISSSGGSGGYGHGSGAPVSTPTSIGQGYIDDNTKNIYIAVGTSSSADWNLLTSFTP